MFCWSCRFVSLSPGDVVVTGTPPGVGVFRKPPVFLKVCTLSLVSFFHWLESCCSLFNSCHTYSYEERESDCSNKNRIITSHVKQRLLGNLSLLISWWWWHSPLKNQPCVPKSVQSNTVLLQSESEVHSTRSNTLITIIFCLFLCFQRGDVVECEIDEIGCISNTVQ